MRYKTIKGMFKARARQAKKFRKKHPIIDRIQTLWYRTKDKPRDAYRAIKRGIQRGYRGYANEDTWGLDSYLSKVIAKSVNYLKENNNGQPVELTEGQWVDILNQIRDTFEMARRMSGGELYLIEDKKERVKCQKDLDKYNKKYKENDRCMTTKEIRAYKNGWKLFQKYYFNLWD